MPSNSIPSFDCPRRRREAERGKRKGKRCLPTSSEIIRAPSNTKKKKGPWGKEEKEGKRQRLRYRYFLLIGTLPEKDKNKKKKRKGE